MFESTIMELLMRWSPTQFPWDRMLMDYYAPKSDVSLKVKGSSKASYGSPGQLSVAPHCRRGRQSAIMACQVPLVDDHKTMRDGIKAGLRHSEEFPVIGELRAGPKPYRFARRSGPISF